MTYQNSNSVPQMRRRSHSRERMVDPDSPFPANIEILGAILPLSSLDQEDADNFMTLRSWLKV